MTPRIFSIARVRRLDRDDSRQVDLREICTTIRKSSTARANALPIGGAWSGHGEDHLYSISAIAAATAGAPGRLVAGPATHKLFRHRLPEAQHAEAQAKGQTPHPRPFRNIKNMSIATAS